MTTPSEVIARTFLDLCQDVARECGVSNSQSAAVPTAVASQTGELGRIVQWTARAWRDIQGIRHWNWMWEEAALTLPVGASVLAGNIPSERYLTDTAMRSTTTSDGRTIEYVPWDDWRRWYSQADINAGNSPTVFSIRPDNWLTFNGIPSVANGGDVNFTVERYKNPTQLMLDTDVPGMPPDLMDLIVYKAMLLYANFDEAGTTRATCVTEVARLERDLISRCLPQMRLGGPLVE